MKTVIVSVTNDLVTDQRVHKVCTTLCNMGFSVHLVGRKLKNSLPLERVYKTSRMRLLFTKGPLFYAEYNIRLFLFLLFAKKSVLLANDLDTLLPNYLISKFTRKPLVYDSHELFTEVPELTHRPRVQNVWLSVEKWIFPKLKHVFTVSEMIVKYYETLYGVEVNLLRNLPIAEDKIIQKQEEIEVVTKNKKAFIYQGAINVGRGIELMIEVVKRIENSVMYIVGTGDVFDEIQNKIKREGLSEKIILTGRLNFEELKIMTPCFDVGFSFEEDLGMNYRYALPNKIFDYVIAGVPVLTSNLIEMKNVVEEYNIGEVLNSREPEKVVEQIKRMLKKDYSTALDKAKQQLNWGKEAEVLKEVYSQFL